MWVQASLPSDPLIAAAHCRSIVFASWCQYVRPTHQPKQHLDVVSCVIKIHSRYRQTDRQNEVGSQPVPTVLALYLQRGQKIRCLILTASL